MREVELKGVVADPDATQRLLEAAGARLVFSGILRDRRYDFETGALTMRDEVVRVRSYVSESGSRTTLDWKGPTDGSSGYKVREELSTAVGDEAALAAILGKLGYVVTREIDRRIAQYESGGATIRLEFYPRMDTLVEVEGDPDSIDRAIEVMGMSRGEFTSESLASFVARFEKRTGVRAAISDRELGGSYHL